MRVLQFPSYISLNGYREFSRNITGFGYMTLDIAVSIAERGIYTELITNGNITNGVKYKSLFILKRTWTDILFNFKWSNFLKAIKVIISDRVKLKKAPHYFLYYISMGYFEKVLKKGNYDLVHIHGLGPSTLPIISVCEKSNIKYLITLHGLNSFSDSIKINDRHRQLEKDFIKLAYKEKIPVTVISSGIKNIILKYLGIANTDNFIVVTNGCNVNENKCFGKDLRLKYDIPADAKIAVCVGNIAEHKNQIQVVRSFSLLPNEIKNKLVILFLGNDMTGGAFDDEIKKSGRRENLIACGNIPKEEVSTYYHCADFNIVASISEGFGLSMIEGFVYGIPTLTFADLDAIPDLYHPKTMFLVKDRSDESLANGIESVFSQAWDNKFIKEYAQQFSLEKMAENYIDVYRKINE